MSFDLFGDFGFVGGQDVAPTPYQNNQLCINFYPEINKQNAKVPVALLGCPGLLPLANVPGGGAPGFTSAMTLWPQPSSVTNLPVRGMWVLPGSAQAIAVIGSTAYTVTPIAGTLALQSIGTLASNAGPVCIRDNGAGGVVCIVDGSQGYFYVTGAAGSAVGPIGTFKQISDPAFLGADRIAFIDGWWIFNQPGTQVFYTPKSTYSTVFSGSNFALIDSHTDNLVTLMDSKEELWLVGERHTEIWYDGGGQYFPFQRLVGTPLQVGCKAKHSIARFSADGEDGLAWFGRSERGENIIVRTKGLNYEVISTPAFSAEVSQYAVTEDAYAYSYQEDTHEFYVLTFPSADVTWVFDSQSGVLHKRASYDPYAQAFHQHRSMSFMNFNGMRIVGDYQNGTLYQLTRNAHTDAGWPLLAKRRTPHVWDKETRGRVFAAFLQVDFARGVGNSSGMGAAPKASLRISRDAGATFNGPYDAPLGTTGNYLARTLWRRLSMSRDMVFDLEVIDPVNRDIVGATLRAHGEA